MKKSDYMQDIMENKPDYDQKDNCPAEDYEGLDGINAVPATGGFFAARCATTEIFTLRFFTAGFDNIRFFAAAFHGITCERTL